MYLHANQLRMIRGHLLDFILNNPVTIILPSK